MLVVGLPSFEDDGGRKEMIGEGIERAAGWQRAEEGRKLACGGT